MVIMKAEQLYETVKNTLTENGIDSATFEASELLRTFANVDVKKLVAFPELEVDETLTFNALSKRIKGTPLQYLIGKWGFYRYEFFVGEGVLIPRSDTEILVEEALKEIKPYMKVADLCSGSGCIAITVSKETNAQVYALEKSAKAYEYLLKNIKLNDASVTAILCDVLKYNELSDLDIIVSNPPYIKTDVIKTLSKEVKKEPIIALDGGEDGLFFYYEITKQWKDKLKKGGKIFFEIGYDQAQDVTEILKQNGFSDICVIKDYSKNDRVVKATLE